MIIYDSNISRIHVRLATFLAVECGRCYYLRCFHDQLKFAVSRRFLNHSGEREMCKLLDDFYFHIINTQYDEAPWVKRLVTLTVSTFFFT